MPAFVGGAEEQWSRGSRAGVLMLRMRCPPAVRTNQEHSVMGLDRGAREARCGAGVLKCTGFGLPLSSEGDDGGEPAAPSKAKVGPGLSLGVFGSGYRVAGLAMSAAWSRVRRAEGAVPGGASGPAIEEGGLPNDATGEEGCGVPLRRVSFRRVSFRRVSFRRVSFRRVSFRRVSFRRVSSVI